MSERRSPASTNPVYSEADLVDFRREWERARQDLEREKELSAIRGQMAGLPDTVKALVKSTVREVLAEEKQSENGRRRSDRRLAIGFAGALLVLVVPLEQVVISLLVNGKP